METETTETSTITGHEKLELLRHFNSKRKRKIGIRVRVTITDAYFCKKRKVSYITRLVYRNNEFYIAGCEKDSNTFPANVDGSVHTDIDVTDGTYTYYYQRRWSLIV